MRHSHSKGTRFLAGWSRMLSSDVCEAAALGRAIWSHGANRFVPGKFGAVKVAGWQGGLAHRPSLPPFKRLHRRQGVLHRPVHHCGR